MRQCGEKCHHGSLGSAFHHDVLRVCDRSVERAVVTWRYLRLSWFSKDDNVETALHPQCSSHLIGSVAPNEIRQRRMWSNRARYFFTQGLLAALLGAGHPGGQHPAQTNSE